MKKDYYDLIEKLIDKRVVGSDTYKHNGSTWLIFTEDRKWVIELTGEKTLWYNYNFFNNIFKVLSLDVVENQHYITKWVEQNIINPKKKTTVIKDTKGMNGIHGSHVAIEDGVKRTLSEAGHKLYLVEDTIENGVKKTYVGLDNTLFPVEDVIENGVKKTLTDFTNNGPLVEDAIQYGITHTNNRVNRDIRVFEDTIENGVTNTSRLDSRPLSSVTNAIENGVKETLHYDHHCLREVVNIIKNGVKETKSPGADGDLLSTIEWMDYNNTDNISEFIDNVIDNGIKKTEASGYLGFIKRRGKVIHQLESPKQNNEIDEVIESGIKNTEAAWYDYTSDTDEVIENGIRSTNWINGDRERPVQEIIKNNITKTEAAMRFDDGEEVEYVIENGIKETKPAFKKIINPMDFNTVIHEEKRIPDVSDVIENGIKETKKLEHDRTTYHAFYDTRNCTVTPMNKVQDVIESGITNSIKEVQPLPAQDGNKDWGLYYNRKGYPTKPHTEYVKDVIENGVKETYDDVYHHTSRVEGVINLGEKLK